MANLGRSRLTEGVPGCLAQLVVAHFERGIQLPGTTAVYEIVSESQHAAGTVPRRSLGDLQRTVGVTTSLRGF